MSLASKIFKGSAKEKITKRGTSFEEGEHIAEIVNLQLFETFDRGVAFIATFKVISSDNPKVKVGSERSWYQGLDGKQSKVGKPLVHVLCFAAEGINRDDLTDEEEEAAREAFEEKLCNLDDTTYVGKRVKVVGKEQEDKKNPGKMYVQASFHPLPAA